MTGANSEKNNYATVDIAKKRIEKELSSKGVEFDSTLLESDISAYYFHLSNEELAPNKEGFTEFCHQEQVSSAVLEMEKDPFRKANKKPLIAVVVAVVLILAGCIGAYAYHENTKVGTPTVKMNIEGWEKDTSTPGVVAIYVGDVVEQLTDDDESNDPEPIKTVELDANTDWTIDGVDERGTYTLEVVATPVLEDGTMFKVPDPQVVELGGDDVEINFDFEVLDPEEASEEDLEKAEESAEESAEASGDDSKKDQVQQAVENNKPDKNTGSSSGSSSSSGGGDSHKGTSSSSGSSSSSGGSSSSGLGSSASDSKPSKPAHTHNWVPHYTKVQVGTQIICDGCGGAFTVDTITAHKKATGHKTTHNEPVYDEVIDYYECSCGATK